MMKTLKLLQRNLLYILLVCVFTSCSDIFPTNQKFVVAKMESYNSNKGKYRYWMNSAKGNTNFWMATDSLYNVGDTLTLNAH